MFEIRGFRPVILFSVCCHFLWGVMLLFSDSPLYITPLGSSAIGFLGQYGNAAIYLITSVLACFHPHGYKKGVVRGFFYSLPQQALINMSALGALSAVMSGAYADGVVRPWEFILSDQIYAILLAPAHILDALRK
jgi:hypothetical protein